MDDLERRIIHLEHKVHYELTGLHRRVEVLEQPLYRVMGAAGWLKIILAICLPLLVLLATGDWHAAVKAVRLSGG